MANFQGGKCQIAMTRSLSISYPDNTILMQDKSKQLVVINTAEYDSKMETILQDKSQYVEVELDPSHHFKFKVLTWQMNILRVTT